MRHVIALLVTTSIVGACGGGGGSGGGGSGGGGPIPSSPVFIHQAAGGSDTTVVRNTLLDGNPDARPVVTQITDPDGAPLEVLNPHPIGVFYDAGTGRWSIRNLDGADIPADAAFFISILPATHPGVFVHTVTAGNRTAHITRIDNPLTDGQPAARLFVTPWINATGAPVVNPEEIGVYFSVGTWRIFNQDGDTMPLGADFIVVVAGDGPDVFRHQATAATIGGASDSLTFVRHPTLDGDPTAFFHVTQNWDPDGIYNEHPVGVGYHPFEGLWFIKNLDEVAMPPNASFNVAIE